MEEHDKAPNASGSDSPWGGKHSYQNVNPEYHQTKLRELHAFLRKNPAGMTVEEVARELRLGSGEAHAMIDAELASRRVGVWGEEQGRPVYVTKQNRSFDPKKMPAGALGCVAGILTCVVLSLFGVILMSPGKDPAKLGQVIGYVSLFVAGVATVGVRLLRKRSRPEEDDNG